MCQRVALPYSELIGVMIGAFLAARTEAAGWPIGVPSNPANASCCWSSRWSWPRKKITLWANSAWLISSTVAGSRSPPRRTPSTRAPIRLPSLVTVTGCVISVVLFEIKPVYPVDYTVVYTHDYRVGKYCASQDSHRARRGGRGDLGGRYRPVRGARSGRNLDPRHRRPIEGQPRIGVSALRYQGPAGRRRARSPGCNDDRLAADGPIGRGGRTGDGPAYAGDGPHTARRLPGGQVADAVSRRFAVVRSRPPRLRQRPQRARGRRQCPCAAVGLAAVRAFPTLGGRSG